MGFELKDYQKKALGTQDVAGALTCFFEAARGAVDGAALQVAFNHARRASMGEHLRDMPYRPLATAPDEGNRVPQVCIRIPTGGGKTLMAAHAIERAARLYIGTRTPVVLWLVPSNAIRTQTRDALLTPGHPYREALLQYWTEEQLTVIDIADCANLRAQEFGSKTIVIVGTRQTLQVENTASRDVYAYKESFEPHFSAIDLSVGSAPYFERVTQADIEANASLRQLLGAHGVDKVKRSFANLLAHHRPIVIADEAHNARGDLSYEVFRRIRPACVIEWTATPAKDQNVLYHVSAQELKAENMIKLPIVLSPHPNWQEAVRDAVLSRERLAAAALGESDYVRPIVLLQADAINGEVPVAKLKEHLMTVHQIDERRIAVATGTQRELDGINLFEKTCAIDFVITVEALKEGWDCSFAYVFCTVQNIRSAKDMEQLLGRVLRLPYAKKCSAEVLNRAYAHVCGASTAAVANQLADRLVAMGFEEVEAASFIQPNGDLFDEFGAQQMPSIAPPPPQSELEVSAQVAEVLRTLMPEYVSAEVATSLAPAPDAKNAGNKDVVRISGLIPDEVKAQVIAASPKKEREEVARLLERHQTATLVAMAPSQRGIAFMAIPQLALPVQGELLLLEPALLTEMAEVMLAGAPADLPDFSKTTDDKPYLIDIARGHLRIEQDREQYTLNLNSGSDGVRREDVIRELDRRVRRGDVLQPDMIAWLGRVLDGLIARGIELNYVVRHLNQLATAIAKRMDALVKEQRSAVFQRSLLDGEHKVCLTDFHQFQFDPNNYPARSLFNGRYQFKKHYYPRPGEMDDDLMQPETACAIEIDQLDEVQYWVRNLALQPQYSFWLPTATDRFYPDFVALLRDGRILVVEYKGGHLFTDDDSREKRDIGAVWAAASEGKCVFAMVTEPKLAGVSVSAQLRAALR
jgi:type III restriction enzyme